MVPTEYSGVAIIDGEQVIADLQLDAAHLRLTQGSTKQILCWLLSSVEVVETSRGQYELRNGTQHFTFQPSVDDGLADEIMLRRRQASPGPEDSAAKETTSDSPLAERVAMAGRSHPRRSFFDSRRSLFVVGAMTAALLTLGLSALLVDTVSESPSQEGTEPASSVTVPATEAPDDDDPASATTVPPTVPGTTATTSPPATPTSTTVATTSQVPGESVFELTPGELTARWDLHAGSTMAELVSSDLETIDTDFGFSAGPFVRVEGSTTEGMISRITLLGDPSGTVDDDRAVLTSLGLALALVEPQLSPEGRAELLSELGLDVEDPQLEGLDGTVEYLDKVYSLRWEPGIERILFEVSPVNA